LRDDGHIQHLGVREASADACRLCALKQVAVAVVEQFPGHLEEFCGGFLGDFNVSLGRAGFEHGIHMDEEAAPGMTADPRPSAHHVCGVRNWHRGIVQELSPLHEALLYLSRAIPEIAARPDGKLLQIPAQVVGFDRAHGRDEAPGLRAVDWRLPWHGRLIDEPCSGGGATLAVLLLEPKVGEFEEELLHGLGLWLRTGGDVGGETLAQRHEKRIHCGLDAARLATHGDIKRLLIEELLQHAEPGSIECQGYDPELVSAASALQVEGTAQLLADPSRLQRLRANHDRVG
jgi:hypothetical protein